jgi:hypothetical protein
VDRGEIVQTVEVQIIEVGRKTEHENGEDRERIYGRKKKRREGCRDRLFRCARHGAIPTLEGRKGGGREEG